MARTTAPLLSFDARGQIAKTQVYAKWKGRPYVRRYTVPANPQTVDQTQTRTVFAWLNNVWRFYPEAARAAWQAYAAARQFTDRNGFIKANLASLRTATDILLISLSPSALSGLVAAGMTLTAGANKITVALTAPALPAGWTIEAAHAVAVREQDPHTGTLYTVAYGTDITSPYSFDITGLVTGQVYVVGGWFSFVRADLTIAYGASLQSTATPT